MVLWLEAVSFDVADAPAVAAFWAGLLGRGVVTEPGGVLVPGDNTQVGLRFVSSATEHGSRSRLHLHLTSSSPDDQQRTVEKALRLGGRHLDVGQGHDDPWVVLADPGGNALCVIEPDNTFLAGTGYLGEVTCDGSRAAGLFWRDALGWPLVWDRGEQTAVQSPLGGTKISWDSWGAQEVNAKSPRTWQRFDLITADVAGESDRLVSLGATRVSESSDGVELADPDGHAFSLGRGGPAGRRSRDSLDAWSPLPRTF
ncbi:VOC family protein [Microlunatus parietis]|uniref:Catechol 2,3-dioxygenase-like lactoylglutathione lyase family enzyme n=1 Tax=Microlunatus parietis TaxID=682979 RepID=A0A7Y9I9I2_9ACTN|nr:VOC family protein [Microlunatus parietis]NYE72259.1 catechol 2,3-dioxygenase-like lactoylglutathione lyase family enzyme [Microlunatus parietis]